MKDNNYNYNNAKKCFEESETNILEKYCGNIHYELKKKKNINISLPENKMKMKSYGFSPLYCEYKLNNKDEIKSLTIETKSNWGEVKMKVKYEDLLDDNELVLGNGDKYIINKPKMIIINFYSNEVRETSPFSIKISSSSMPINNTIISIISFCGVLFIFIIVIIIFIYRRKMQRRDLRLAIIINNNNINGVNNIIMTNPIYGLNSERVGLINFLNQIKPIKFKDIKAQSKNTKCPIDIEYFTDKSDVFFTTCSHSFHYHCLKDYVSKNNNLKELKCPLCKTILFTYKINENENNPSNVNSQNNNV